jgi:phage terminase large subunit
METETVHQLVGPFARIFRTLMSHDPLWIPGRDDGEDLPFYEWSVEGKAGTGKTFWEGVLLEHLHSRFSGLRSLVLRKTRVSLNESFLQVFEDDVLGTGHPMRAGASRAHRTKYVWPNGSETILGGMDNPTRLFSTQYDLVLFVEGIEFTADEYQSIYRAMRNPGVPFKAIITDTNPGAETHFLNRWPENPNKRMERVLTDHKHNPVYYDPVKKAWTPRGRQYRENLDQLSGVLRKRLRDGLWCAAEGAVWPNFSHDVHLVDPGKVTKKHPDGENLPHFDYFIGGIDWGVRDPKVLQVWGVTKTREAYRVYERYKTETPIEEFVTWLEEVKELYGRRRLKRIVADHDPELINLCNEKLGWRGGRTAGNMIVAARKGAKSIKAGCELVRDMLGNPESVGEAGAMDKPRMFFVKGALREVDPALEREGLPFCTEQEIPSYVYRPPSPNGRTYDEPDPGCVDHGCDTTRYAANEIWKSDFTSARGRVQFGPGTLGHELGHNDFIQDMTDAEYAEWIKHNDV